MTLHHIRNKTIAATAIYLLLVSVCHAEKLEDVVRQVACNNPEILMRSAIKYANTNQLRDSVGGYLPSIDFAAAYGRDHNKNFFTRLENPTNGNLTLTRSEAGFSIKQMLFDGFGVRSSVEADSARVKASSLEVLAKLDDVIVEVTAAYIDTIMLRSIYMHAKENVANHQKMLDILTSDQAPDLKKGDIDLARSRLSQAQSWMLNIQRDIRDSQAEYIKVVGAKPGVMFRPDAPDKLLPTSEESAVAVAVNNNPLVAIANTEIQQARAEKRGARANYFPKLDLELYGMTGQNVDGYNQHINSLGAMLLLKYNIFRGGKDVAQEKKAGWMVEEKKYSLSENIRLIERNMRKTWSAYVNYKGQLSYLKERVETLQKTRDSYYGEFMDSKRDIFEVMDAEGELYNAKANYVAAQYKELLSRFIILKEMGKIREYFRVTAPVSAQYHPNRWVDGY